MRPIRFTVTDGGAYDGKTIPLDVYVPNSQLTIQCDVTGTVAYTVQYTVDDIWTSGATVVWNDFPVAGLVGASTDQVGSTNIPMTAVRVNQASGAGSVRVSIVQQSTQ